MSSVVPLARPFVGDVERRAADDLLNSGTLGQGHEIAALEKEFESVFRLGRHCIAVDSGLAGLHLGLLAAGVEPGDEVIIPSFGFSTTAEAVVSAGATPVFADIDPFTFCLDPDSARDAISPRTVGIMPVHLYGHPANMPAFADLAAERGLILFEDALQAHGAALGNRPVGTFGSAAVFSAYPTTEMTFDEGGMITAGSADIERRIRLHGSRCPSGQGASATTIRMTDIHGAIARALLPKVHLWSRQRRENAGYLSRNLRGVGVPFTACGASHVFYQYTIRVPSDRDGFAAALAAEYQIESRAFNSQPVHRRPAFASDADLPHTDRAARQALSIPVHPALSIADLDRIVSAVGALARAGG